jgi:hypothetical protein
MKFNDSLYLYISDKVSKTHQFCISTITPCSSTFVLLEYEESFFDSVEWPLTPFEAKILAKPLVNILKLNLDSLVQSTISLEQDRIRFKIECRHGIDKAHALQFEETPIVRAVYRANECSNSCMVNSKVWLDVLSNFPSQLGNVSLIFDTDGFQIQTVSETTLPQTHASEGLHRRLDTAVTVDLDDFESFSVQQHTKLTVNAKELKGKRVNVEGIDLWRTKRCFSPNFVFLGWFPLYISLRC